MSEHGKSFPDEVPMGKNIPRTGKRIRPKTAVKGKRFRCARCRRRSPKPVKTPAPWYCSNCLNQDPALGIKAGSEVSHVST
jgi:hypothetical protein